MRRVRAFVSVLVLGLGAGWTVLEGQQVGAPRIVTVSEAEIRKRSLSGAAPGYPQIARAARVEGLVRVELLVGPDGAVEQASIVEGHPMLDQAALDAARGWRFAPMVSGNQAVRMRAVVSIPFALAGSAEVERRMPGLVELADRCQEHLRLARLEDAVSSCRGVGEQAAGIPTRLSAQLIWRAEPARAQALMALERPREAADVLERLVRGLHRDLAPGEARADAHRLLAAAHAATGDVANALKACRNAERDYGAARSAARRAGFPTAELLARFRDTLLECAALYDKAGKPGDAAKARKRAAELN